MHADIILLYLMQMAGESSPSTSGASDLRQLEEFDRDIEEMLRPRAAAAASVAGAAAPSPAAPSTVPSATASAVAARTTATTSSAAAARERQDELTPQMPASSPQRLMPGTSQQLQQQQQASSPRRIPITQAASAAAAAAAAVQQQPSGAAAAGAGGAATSRPMIGPEQQTRRAYADFTAPVRSENEARLQVGCLCTCTSHCGCQRSCSGCHSPKEHLATAIMRKAGAAKLHRQLS